MYIFALAAGASVLALVVLFPSELGVVWKSIAVGMVVAAFGMEFIPPLRVHFLVPLLMQIAVALWGFLYMLWPREL